LRTIHKLFISLLKLKNKTIIINAFILPNYVATT